MKLIFVRHGQAGPYCADDAGRNLTEFGQRQAQITAQQLLGKYRPKLIIASPFNRAWQTAQIIQKTYQNQGIDLPLVCVNTITPDDDPKLGLIDVEQVLQSHGIDQENTAIVVCHMPIVARMTSHLTGLPEVMFGLASYQALDVPVVFEGLATLVDEFCPPQP